MVGTIVGFSTTACNVSDWQLAMIDVADSLGMIDRETLHKNQKTAFIGFTCLDQIIDIFGAVAGFALETTCVTSVLLQ